MSISPGAVSINVVNYLHSLTPSEEMYEACCDMKGVDDLAL